MRSVIAVRRQSQVLGASAPGLLIADVVCSAATVQFAYYGINREADRRTAPGLKSPSKSSVGVCLEIGNKDGVNQFADKNFQFDLQ